MPTLQVHSRKHRWIRVDTRGSHALSCRRNPGRSQRHHFVNDLIWRSLSKAGFPSIKEPQGLRSDAKRPDGLTLIPWPEERCARWDVTVTDTVAASYLNATSCTAGSAAAAEAAASRKEEKYAAISSNYLFFPLAFETFGPIKQAGRDFLSSLGHRLSLVSEDPRESYLFIYFIYLFINLLSSVSGYLFLFSDSTLYVSAIHSGTCRPNFLTSRDAPRAL